jgi:hypothetical protein
MEASLEVYGHQISSCVRRGAMSIPPSPKGFGSRKAKRSIEYVAYQMEVTDLRILEQCNSIGIPPSPFVMEENWS